jgi:hypothetical protein
MTQAASHIGGAQRAGFGERSAVAAFGGAAFLSAALLFMVQPMAGRMLLPLVGGTPAGWVVAIAFFQTMLLLGYLLAHALAKLPPMAHGLLYLAVLGAGGLFLPERLGAVTPDAGGVFLALAAALGFPFVALAATSSTLQRLFAGTRHPAARDPHFLYAASNLGSFAGLLAYPFLVEPLAGLAAQARGWQGGYAALGLAGLACLACFRDMPAAAAKKTAAVPLRRREIFILAFVPSALLLAVTTHIVTDIVSAPLVWIVPLALYLLTFAAAFGRAKAVSPALVAKLHPFAVAGALFLLLAFTAHIRGSWIAVAGQLCGFTVAALMCHLRLAALRPVDEGNSLTGFYLLIAAGGAAGGLLNAFVFPVVLDRLVEYPVLLLLSCLLHPSFWSDLGPARRRVFTAAVACLYAYAFFVMTGFLPAAHATEICDLLLFAVLALAALHPRALLVTGALLVILSEGMTPHENVMTARNFYGVVRVFDQPAQIDGRNYTKRYLYHGTTTHGFQIRDPRYETTPTSYFTAAGPIGDIFALYNPHKILVMGLGAGTLACYKRPDTDFTFIEIDPAVVRAAREAFTYLEKCGQPRVITGDGRLELQKDGGMYDMIVLDAFSSDSIPTHLLTVDAIEGYLARLNKNGLLLFNITNRYFDLGGTLAADARVLGLKHRYVLDAAPALPYAMSSKWIAMGRQSMSMQPLSDMGWTEMPANGRPWTDDDTNLLSALEF